VCPIWPGPAIICWCSSTDKKRNKKKHTWLQRFDLEGRPAGEPLKLEKAWGAYHDNKNWEGLDWTLSGAGVVMAYDEKDADKHRALVVFRYA
jgi:hypothetical protein